MKCYEKAQSFVLRPVASGGRATLRLAPSSGHAWVARYLRPYNVYASMGNVKDGCKKWGRVARGWLRGSSECESVPRARIAMERSPW